MSLNKKIFEIVPVALKTIYDKDFTDKDFQVNITKPDFEGDYTIVLFPLLKKTSKKPAELGQALGDHLVNNYANVFSKYNVIQGFLNLTINDAYWLEFLQNAANNLGFGKSAKTGKKVMVEYSSPNTNKPIHLGHLRNNFLGWSIAELLDAAGNDVVKTCIVNDRGVHICKSMYAWQKFANGATPSSTNIKGDHFVGDYYVMFEGILKNQEAELTAKEESGNFSHYAEDQKAKFDILQAAKVKLDGANDKDKIEKINDDLKQLRRDATPAMQDVKQMLLDWETGQSEVVELWKNMNGWVYEGFDVTYKKIGVTFDKTYYESNTYLLGKDLVQKGLAEGVFFRKEDGSVWIDLTADGLDEKLVLRKDGTSVYITQDLGLVNEKYKDFKIDESIYVIADEQNYHMKVLQLIAQKLGLPSADGIKHLSYGMVELPTGKMKSREGSVVDADDIVAEMESVAKQKTEELGKVQAFNEADLSKLYETIGLGALKFFLLRVDPKKKMLFNPLESIDFHGFTAPFIQFNYARISSVLKKFDLDSPKISNAQPLLPLEKQLLAEAERFPIIIKQAADELNPSLLAIYVYELAKSFSSFYTEHSIGNAESDEKKHLRLMIAQLTANIIKNGMLLLGIHVPERM